VILQFIGQLLIPVISTSCVMAVVAYGLVRTKFLDLILSEKLVFKNQLFLILPFTVFSVYGTVNAIPVTGGFVALSHVGQIVGGLLAGPIVGIGTGTILTIYRYSLGDYLALPAALACMLAGLFAGLYHEWYKEWNKEKLNAQKAIVLTILVELFGSGLSLLLLPDFERALRIEMASALPMIIGNASAVGLFIFILNTLINEKHMMEIKERIESELRVARDIQLSLVPKTFPCPPHVQEFEVYAVLEPAKEVGGDLYDFFFIDDEHFCIVIGDVSGKGIPAALFMSATRSVMKSQADKGKRPADILDKVNNELCRGNDTCMFVTLFCGILNIYTGEVIFSNAGHNPPYIYRRNGLIEEIEKIPGIALGIVEDMMFGEGRFVLAQGDTFVMYTDGVSEAMDTNNNMFTEQRLQQTLKNGQSWTPKRIIENMMRDVSHFTEGAEQSDDITILTLTYQYDGESAIGITKE